MKSNIRFWVLGIILAVAGVVTARLISPRFADQALIQLVLFFSGVVLAMAGLGLILFGIRKR